jgi:two-component system KDP operon response regulator KdpE
VSARRPSVLLVEDDDPTRTELARNLRLNGYDVMEAAMVETALQHWEQRRPDLIVLDLGLPDGDGMSVLFAARKEATTPVVILSARGEERAKVVALNRGADDYLTKPVGTAELNARLRAVLRRAAGPAADAQGIVRNGSVELDPMAHVVRVAGRVVDLTPREYQILALLLSHPGHLVTRGRILRAVWGEAYQGDDHLVHVHVSKLRQKLGEADASGDTRGLIVTEPGVGYRVREARPES